MRINPYVDGFNLYNRMLRNEPGTKWLDLNELGRRLFPQETIEAVKYYTARIKPLDDPAAPQRQDIYLRALETLPNASVHFGYFQVNTKWRRLQYPLKGLTESVRVKLPEEKGSDVNLASHLIADGFWGNYESAAVLSNDADLAEPIRLVQHDLGLPVVLIYPTASPAGKLVSARPTQLLKLSPSTVRASQFPKQLSDSGGMFHKPSSW